MTPLLVSTTATIEVWLETLVVALCAEAESGTFHSFSMLYLYILRTLLSRESCCMDDWICDFCQPQSEPVL